MESKIGERGRGERVDRERGKSGREGCALGGGSKVRARKGKDEGEGCGDRGVEDAG